MNDLFDEFLEYDFTMGVDVVKCPHCGGDVQCSLFIDSEVECSGCGKKFHKDELRANRKNPKDTIPKQPN